MKRIQKLRISHAALAWAGCLALVAPAAAQDGEAPAAEETRSLEKVVITAQKRDQSMEDVPISVTAIAGDGLEESGVESVVDLPQLVPGLRMDLAGGFFQPTIRGVGSSIAGAGFVSNVATYIDGFYVPSQNSTDMELMNLQSVQVLKGPQGTLFGRNATGGAILLTTADPSFDPTARLRLTAGNYGKFKANFYGATGLSDTVAVDVAALYDTGDGYLDNIVTGADDDGAFETTAFRASALFEPTDTMSFELAYSHSDQDNPGPVTASALDGALGGESIASAINSVNPALGAIVATEPNTVSNTSPTAFTVKTDGLFLTSKFDLGFADLTSFTMFREEEGRSTLDLDSSSAPIFNVTWGTANEAFSQEFNLTGDVGPVNWIVGAYYLSSEEDYEDFSAEVPLNAIPMSDLYTLGNSVDAFALFADVTVNVAENWFLTLGGRYSEEEADAYYNVEPIGAALGVAPTPGLTEFSGSWDSFTPRAVVRYEPTDNSSVYVSYSEGFKSGLLAPSGFTTTPVDPENIKAWEVGYKYAGASMQLDAAVFHYDYEDLQRASYIGVAAIITNAATSTVQGAELQWTQSITDGLTVNAGFSYTKAEYDEYANAPSFAQNLDPALLANPATAPFFGLFIPSSADAAGNVMQRSPEFSGNVGAQYEAEVAGGTLRLNGNYFYTDDFYFDDTQSYKQEAYGLLNLRAAWTDPSDHWEVAVFANNVTDEEYLNQVLPGTYAIQTTWGAPATYGASLTCSY